MGVDLRGMEPEAVAYPVAYIASEESSWLNGRVVGAQGGKLTLYENYHPEQAVSSVEPSTIETIFEQMPKTFHPDRQGLGGMGWPAEDEECGRRNGTNRSRCRSGAA